MNTIIKTQTGSIWHTDKLAHSNLITHLSDNGTKVMSDLAIKAIVGTHYEFGELKTDLLVIDEFGESYELCEDFIYQ